MLLNTSIFASEVQKAMNQFNAQGLVLHHALQSKSMQIHLVVIMEYSSDSQKWLQRREIKTEVAQGEKSERRVYAVIRFSRSTVWRYFYRLFAWRNKFRILSIAGIALACNVGFCGLVVSATLR